MTGTQARRAQGPTQSVGEAQAGEPNGAQFRLAGDDLGEEVKAGRPSLLAVGMLVLLATLPFLNSFGNGFAFDDRLAIVEDPRITSLKNIPLVLSSGYWAGIPEGGRLYRPLVTTSYAVNYALGGLQPFGYHLTNLLLHLVASLLLYRIALRLFCHQEGAWVAAALFAVHPLHTEAVTGIVGRAELFAALFFLLAWWWDLEHRGRLRYLAGAFAAFGLALISKEHAVALPLVLVLSDLYVAKNRDTQWRPEAARAGLWFVWRYVGYLLVLIGYLLCRFVAVGVGLPRPSLLDNPLAHLPLVPRLMTALVVAGRYLWLMVWPQYLSADYSYNQIPAVNSPMAPGLLLALLAWGTLIGIAAWSYARGRQAFLCAGFTLVTFLPASNFLIPIGTILGERLFYLPSAGLCLLAGVVWRGVEDRRRGTKYFHALRRVGLVLLATVIVLLSARTVVRNRDWQNDATLFLSALEIAPNSAKVHFNVGSVYLEKRLYDDAVRELKASVAILPWAQAHRKLATVYLRQGLLEAATTQYREALGLGPHDAGTNKDLGYVLLKQGMIEEAIAALKTAILLDPQLADAHYTLGRALVEQDRWPEAIAAYQEARRLKPDFMEASYALGLALEETGQYRAAAEAFEEALRLKPGLKMAHRRLAELYRTALGDPEKAREHLRQAEKEE